MTQRTADVIVIGCGGFGSAAMYHLASRGLKVVGIDQFHPPHDRGSSHAQTRIIRKAYFEHPDYVPLLHQAWDLWRELEGESGTLLLQQRDLLLSGPIDSQVTGGARLAAARHGLALEDLSREEARRRFPMFAVPDDHSLTLEHTAGILFCDDCVRTHLELALTKGAMFVGGQIVRRVIGDTSSVTVQTDDATWTASAAVFTAGAWTAQLLPAYSKWIRVIRKPIFWHPATDPAWTSPAAPIFLLDLPEGQFYGLPSVDDRTIKVGEHTRGDLVSDVNTLDRSCHLADREPVEQFVSRRLTGVATHATSQAVCMYSMSPDGHFLFDRLPDMPLIVAAGFSGHGFKFTSVLGEASADLVQNGSTGLPVEFLSSTRLSLRR